MFSKQGTIDAHALPNGTFISTDMQLKRLSIIRNDTTYRENLEKAQRVAGYEDKLMLVARGGGDNKEAIESLMKQGAKAEHVRGKSNENGGSLIIPGR